MVSYFKIVYKQDGDSGEAMEPSLEVIREGICSSPVTCSVRDVIGNLNSSLHGLEGHVGWEQSECLLKGSVSAAERPRTLRRLRNVYSPAIGGSGGMGTGADVAGEQRLEHNQDSDMNNHHRSNSVDREQRDDKTLSVMSPFDEQEEWAKISEIMASFGTGLVRESVFVNELEKEFQARLGLNSDMGSPCVTTLVGQWLSKLNLADYESVFLNYGFDDLEFINGVLDETDLKEMGVSSEQERSVIMDAVSLLNNRVDKRPVIVNQTVDDWLKSIHLDNYADLFRRHLYTDMDRVRRVWEVELAAVLEIQKPAHRKRILASVNGGGTSPRELSTNNTTSNHARNGNGPNFDDLNKDLNALKSNIQQLKDEIREKLPNEAPTLPIQKNGLPTPTSTTASTTTSNTTGTNANTTGTLKHRKNRPAPPPPQKPSNIATAQQNGSSTGGGQVQAPEHLEIRGPSELLFGVPSTLKAQWRHKPKDLVTGCVTYVANYLGSTVVKELRGTESTKKSIQKLKKICRDPRGTPDITLSISFRGVRFLNTLTEEPICEHEVRNIHCACQDAEDLTHFAYITKDHPSNTHFCHVFCVPTMDQATEIILTLGQAFEVAYQIALKDKLGGHAIRSQSASQLATLTTSSSNSSLKSARSPSQETSQNNHHNNETNNHYQTSTNPRPKHRSKSITNPFINPSGVAPNSGNHTQQKSSYRISSPKKSPSHSSTKSVVSSSSANSRSGTTNGSPVTVKLLATHGRSHSVNEIKLNGKQAKLATAPVDDIGIGVKDMKAGSRAPIALSEEL